MNMQEAAAVLAKVQAYDNRTVGEANIRAWQEALADITLADALAAVSGHYQESAEWLMPAHVRTRAVEIRRQRQKRQMEAEQRRQLEAYAARAVGVRDRSAEVQQLVDQVRTVLPPSDPTVLRRKEWVRAERDRQRGDPPNPHYQGPPPPGGWPVPESDERTAS